MCWAGASSTIAVQNVQWGLEEDRKYLGIDWTKDPKVWSRFLAELLSIPKLKNIHFMGGETLLTPRFEEFVDFMIANKRFDLSFSFVTNGTVFKPTLMDKLKQFARVGIEVSIETTTQHNNYVRQGTDTNEVLVNIQRYITYCNSTTISLTVRPAISALTVGYYYTLLEYCLEHKLLIKSLIVTDPVFLNVNVLPKDIRLNYVKNYENLLNKLADVRDQYSDFNESDPNNYSKIIKLQSQQVINLLNSNLHNTTQIPKLIEHCLKWDNVYKLNLLELYPEFKEMRSDLPY
jgi:sulfatase maturation enzyme AslB (radical SAM superfamily)